MVHGRMLNCLHAVGKRAGRRALGREVMADQLQNLLLETVKIQNSRVLKLEVRYDFMSLSISKIILCTFVEDLLSVLVILLSYPRWL